MAEFVKIYRGVATTSQAAEVLEKMLKASNSFDLSPQLILNKICLNNAPLGSPEYLQSFSWSQERAKQFCGSRGWLFEFSIPLTSLLIPQAVLEGLKSLAFQSQQQELIEMCEEALDCSGRDEEVFVKTPLTEEMLVEVTEIGGAR